MTKPRIFGTDKRTVSTFREKAYGIMDKMAWALMQQCMAEGVEPEEMVEPLLALAARMTAATACAGKPLDVTDLLAKFPQEVSHATREMLAKVN